MGGSTLTLKGTGDIISLKVVSPTELQVPSEGFSAVLKEDGKLHWSDGDIWVREGEVRSEDLDNRSVDRSEERSESRQVEKRSPSTNQVRDGDNDGQDRLRNQTRSRSRPRGSDAKRRR